MDMKTPRKTITLILEKYNGSLVSDLHPGSTLQVDVLLWASNLLNLPGPQFPHL